jgi:hypothetical protein
MKTQSTGIRVGEWMRRVRYLTTVLIILTLLLGSSSTTARAAETIVVGDGTPESCTEVTFKQAIADVPIGGIITFNCGPDPITILIFDTAAKIQKDLTIDGGGLITFTTYQLIFYVTAATVEFRNLTLADRINDAIGGIINYGTLTLHHVIVENKSNGHGYAGGAIANGGVLTFEDSILVGDSGGCSGGVYECYSASAIVNFGTLRVLNSTIWGNSANYPGGGGIFNEGTATIENSTIRGNSTGCLTYYDDNGLSYLVCHPGGGILNSGTMSLINSTISGNSTGIAPGGGGGGIDNTGTLFLQNTTIADNSAYSGGGLANHNSTTMQNSILAGNKDANQQPSDCLGALMSQGYNLIGSTTDCNLTGDTTGDLLGADPLLSPLQDNGGPTFTYALLPGSPAIDAGNPATPGTGGMACETTDQRGVARPQDGDGDGLARCDIGAFELAGETPSVLAVNVDIKPGSSTNPINLQSTGVIAVAILSTATFDASTVNPASVTFGPSEATSTQNSLEDVNGDGRLDLVLHFRTQQTGIQLGDTQACLVGQTRSGTAIEGCDHIHIVL